MKRFTDAGRRALADGNLYAALSLALTLPDICASLEDPGTGKSKQRYIKWCAQWVEPKFTVVMRRSEPPHVFLSAEDMYNLRNSLIHSGGSEFEPSRVKTLTKAEFFDETTGSHMNLITGVLQLRAAKFSETLYEAADEWDLAKASDAAVQAEKANLLIIHSAGTKIVGSLVEIR